MAWNISAGAIRNPIPPILLILALVFAGWTAYGRLPINQLPNVNFGGFDVIVSQAGAAPAEMETQITQRIENALTSVEGVRRVTSTISPGVSQTEVEMESGGDLNRAIEDARDALGRIRSELPADISEPVIIREDAASQPIGYYAVDAQGMTPEEISTTTCNASCSRFRVLRKCSAWVASIAKSASSSIPHACSPMASPPTRSTTSCGR
jgi:multidrug efflux pump subunit AcrB